MLNKSTEHGKTNLKEKRNTFIYKKLWAVEDSEFVGFHGEWAFCQLQPQLEEAAAHIKAG